MQRRVRLRWHGCGALLLYNSGAHKGRPGGSRAASCNCVLSGWPRDRAAHARQRLKHRGASRKSVTPESDVDTVCLCPAMRRDWPAAAKHGWRCVGVLHAYQRPIRLSEPDAYAITESLLSSSIQCGTQSRLQTTTLQCIDAASTQSKQPFWKTYMSDHGGYALCCTS